jgi:hypothetical protein
MVAVVIQGNLKKTLVMAVVGSGGICFWQESGFSCHEDVFIFTLCHKEIL